MSTTRNKPWSEAELLENIGQLFIVGFDDHVPNADVKLLISKYKVGSIILFQRNVSTASQLLDLTKSLQGLAQSAGHDQPLFISIDQENGLVTRIKEPIAAQLPGPMALAATGDPKNAYDVASATAATLKGFGINMNYAPIADVNSEPENPVIGVRSFSDNPDTVGRFVSAQVRGLRDGGIVPCVKHFPGHGDTAVDSHYGLPEIIKSKQSLDSCELVPFRRAVAEGVESIMTAHIALPGLSDPRPGEELDKLPASLNPVAIDILRKEMKYNGLIVSDCLEMDGVRATYGTEAGAVKALMAGTDCVMICHTMASQVGAIERVVEAVKSGSLSQQDIEEKVERVRLLKKRYAENWNSLSKATISGNGYADQRDLAAKIYAQSTTLVRSEPGVIPISKSSELKTVFLSPVKDPLPSGVVESGIESTTQASKLTSYIEAIRVHVPTAKNIHFNEDIVFPNDSWKDVAEADTVILATKNARLSRYQKDFAKKVSKTVGSRLIVIATCDPYDFMDDASEIKNYFTIYEPTVPAFKAAIDVIFGVSKARGVLPVGSSEGTHEIQQFVGSDAGVDFVWKLYNEIFPKWPMDLQKMKRFLVHPTGHHFIHEKGFCLAFLTGAEHGRITCIGVAEESRGKGIGTALIKRAQEHIRGVTFMAGREKLLSFEIGSIFPRFWPGVPIYFPQESKNFLVHRGFQKQTAPTARDMYKDIRNEIAPAAVLERVSKLDLTFAPWSPEGYEECMKKQRANFKQIGWVQAYERLAATGQHHEVMVAYLPDGSQVGWTVMCSATSVVGEIFAYLNLFPSKDKTGLIACVGVDESGRGKGVGLALLVKAMENMRARGIEGVCIDWVVIRGFYETLGYEPFWEYEGYKW
ncbi:beta-N-acetylglucosaminidase [Phlyctema vagabunda]|uniref:Beta-N-acetylglucosaminidase n=1 Tax=Phlyctema vagabunda TaxID=108571 RepID=A0ABR4PNK1_9HELO